MKQVEMEMVFIWIETQRINLVMMNSREEKTEFLFSSTNRIQIVIIEYNGKY